MKTILSILLGALLLTSGIAPVYAQTSHFVSRQRTRPVAPRVQPAVATTTISTTMEESWDESSLQGELTEQDDFIGSPAPAQSSMFIRKGSLDNLPYRVTGFPQEPTVAPDRSKAYYPRGKYTRKTTKQLRKEGLIIKYMPADGFGYMLSRFDGRVGYNRVVLLAGTPAWTDPVTGRPLYHGICNNPLPIVWWLRTTPTPVAKDSPPEVVDNTCVSGERVRTSRPPFKEGQFTVFEYFDGCNYSFDREYCKPDTWFILHEQGRSQGKLGKNFRVSEMLDFLKTSDQRRVMWSILQQGAPDLKEKDKIKYLLVMVDPCPSDESHTRVKVVWFRDGWHWKEFFIGLAIGIVVGYFIPKACPTDLLPMPEPPKLYVPGVSF